MHISCVGLLCKHCLTFSYYYYVCRENISRGRKKHIWVSVSADLYEDAKRDLSDLGLDKYAFSKCYSLSNYKKSEDTIKQDEGVMFTTYNTLIAKNRLDQLLQWCGDSFDGLIMLDECHRCKSIELDGEGNAKKSSSKTGAYHVRYFHVSFCQSVHLTQPSISSSSSNCG